MGETLKRYCKENDMKDYEKDWDRFETTPIRQFDLNLAHILDVVQNKPKEEAIQYVRGLRDGNRFGRKCPPILPIDL